MGGLGFWLPSRGSQPCLGWIPRISFLLWIPPQDTDGQLWYRLTGMADPFLNKIVGFIIM